MALLNRATEWARMEKFLDRCMAGKVGILWLEGAAGCGKTELLNRLCGAAEGRGARVLTATGRAAEQDTENGILAQLTAPVSGSRISAGPEFPAILRGLADTRPLLLCVDDLQYADEASLGQLLHAFRALRDAPVLLALGEGPGGPAAYDAEARTELLRHPGFVRVPVGRLDAQGTAELLARHTAGAPAAPPLRPARRLHRLTGGNPLLVKALLSEHLDHIDQQWPAPAPAGPFAQAVATCLRRSGPGAHRLAAAIAVLGDAATADLVTAVADLDPAAARRAAQALDAAGLTEGRRLRHPQIAAGVREFCAPAELAALRLRAARALHESGARATAVAEQLLLVRAELRKEEEGVRAHGWAVPALREAARQALLDDDCGYAVGCLTLARDLTADEAERHRLTLRLATLLRRTDPAAAEAEPAGPLRALRAGALPHGAAGLLARVLVAQGRVEEAAEALESAERRRTARTSYEDPLRPLLALPPEGAGRTESAQAGADISPAPPVASVASVAAGGARGAGGNGRAAASTALVRTPVTRTPPPGAQARAASRLGTPAATRACAALWNHTGGDEVSAASVAGVDGVEEQLRDTPLAHHTVDLILQAVRVLVHTDRCARAVVWCQKLQAETERGASPGWFAALGLTHSQALFRLGDLKGAARAAATAAEKVEGRGGTLLYGLIAAEVAALTAQGRYEAVARRLELPVPDDLFHSVHALDYLRARGHYYLATHRHRAALGEFHDAGRLARRWALDRPRQYPWRADAATVLLRLGERMQAERYVSEQLASTDVRSPRVHGTTLRLRAALAPPAERPRLLTRAVEELRRSGDRLEHARALADLGHALQLAGEGNRAGTMTRRAWHLAAECGAVPLCDAILPGHAEAAARDAERAAAGRGTTGRGRGTAYDRLSESERRIAALATLGYTNREISAKLYVTISTVEQHLTQVYRKLNISRRQELPLELQFDEPADPRRGTGARTTGARTARPRTGAKGAM